MIPSCNFGPRLMAQLRPLLADYTPKIVADHKIKKQEAQLAIELVPTRDILAAMGREKRKINGWLASP